MHRLLRPVADGLQAGSDAGQAGCFAPRIELWWPGSAEASRPPTLSQMALHIQPLIDRHFPSVCSRLPRVAGE